MRFTLTFFSLPAMSNSNSNATPALILSGLPHDMHAHAVRWALQQAGAPVLWLHTFADRALQPSISMAMHPDTGLQWHGGPADGAFGAIWFRRPRHPRAAYLPHVGADDLEFVSEEWKRYDMNLFALAAGMPGAFWVNPPQAAHHAENKLVQLQAAQRCGLRFPPTLVSSDPVQIRAFAARHAPVVYKPFQTHSWQDADGRFHSTYADTVSDDQLRDDASLQLCPGIFQAQVRKRCDLRVMLIGQHMFTVKVTSPETGDVDWRATSLLEGRVQIQRDTLPAAIESSLRALMRELGLVFGCVDLVVDAEGELHFLEINQSGQFLFLEPDVPELPLLRAFSAMLMQARPDYSLDAMPAQVSLAAYLDSDHYRQWWDEVAPTIRSEGHIPGVTRETADA